MNGWFKLRRIPFSGLPANFAFHSTTCSFPRMASESLGPDFSMPSAADWTRSLRNHMYVLPMFWLKGKTPRITWVLEESLFLDWSFGMIIGDITQKVLITRYLNMVICFPHSFPRPLMFVILVQQEGDNGWVEGLKFFIISFFYLEFTQLWR